MIGPDDPPPEPPPAPEPGECCGGGCTTCVLDAYDAAMERYQARLAEWQRRQSAADRPG